MRKLALCLAIAGAVGASAPAVSADELLEHHQQHEAPAARVPDASDTRQLVTYPEHLRLQTLANMRDHLLTMGKIQDALSRGAFDQAGELAETRLGMSSLEMHGAHEVARYMPKGMQDAGAAMHHSASQFALAANNASVTGDLKPVLASLATLNQTCVACHAAYRLK